MQEYKSIIMLCVTDTARKENMNDLKWQIIFGIVFVLCSVSLTMFALHQWAIQGGI